MTREKQALKEKIDEELRQRAVNQMKSELEKQMEYKQQLRVHE